VGPKGLGTHVRANSSNRLTDPILSARAWMIDVLCTAPLWFRLAWPENRKKHEVLTALSSAYGRFGVANCRAV